MKITQPILTKFITGFPNTRAWTNEFLFSITFLNYLKKSRGDLTEIIIFFWEKRSDKISLFPFFTFVQARV